MKFLVSILFCAVIFSSANAQEEEGSLTGPKILFTETVFDFGDIIQGDRVEHIFEFENAGNEPLILSDVRTTCGCTAPQWPRNPIAPGEKAKLKVVFNSAGKMNQQNKVITVMSNAVSSPDRVTIKANIGPAKIDN